VTILCDTFRSLAFRTWDQLARARRVGHQPLEETFTDVNLLELKDRHPREVITQVFNKPKEGINGADWEWWLTDAAGSQWLGLRVQAKVLDLRTNKFEHLHYRNGRAYQASKLQNTCGRLGLVPLYCLYMQSDKDNQLPDRCGSFAHAKESFGCSLVSLAVVNKLRRAGSRRGLIDLAPACVPWHCLVCCEGYGGNSLPERGWELLQAVLEIRPSRQISENTPQVGIRPEPPLYVRRLLDQPLSEPPDSALRGIVVVKETESNERSPADPRQ
jgi:hypothetical protein